MTIRGSTDGVILYPIPTETFRVTSKNIKKIALLCLLKILIRFYKLAWEYPHGYWYTDQDDISTGESIDESEDSDSLEINIGDVLKEYPDYAITEDQLSSLAGLFGLKEGDRYVICYNFPDTGHRAVKTKKDALEIIEYAINDDDPRAISWTRLAFMLPK